MEYNNENLLELLDYIDPALLDYTDWTGIGMAQMGHVYGYRHHRRDARQNGAG